MNKIYKGTVLTYIEKKLEIYIQNLSNKIAISAKKSTVKGVSKMFICFRLEFDWNVQPKTDFVLHEK